MSISPKVSVIIPVYNASAFLRQCMDSVVNQTLQDIEIICVDDGSTDASLDILHEYASNDSRITILIQQNKGAGAARNTGMQIAHGKYLAFFDSDDFFDLTLLEKASSRADATNADIVLYGARAYNNETHEYSSMNWVLNKTVIPDIDSFSPFDICDSVFQITSGAPWSKLFNRDFSERNGLKFQDLRNSEDVFYVLSAISIAKSISWIDEELVSYRVGLKTSLESTKDLYPLEFYKAWLALRSFLLSHDLYYSFESSFNLRVAGEIQYNFNIISQKALPKYVRENIASEFGLEMFGSQVIPSSQTNHIDVAAILTSGKPCLKFKPAIIPSHVICDTRDASVHPLISVIIPIYNVEKYLGKCLDSIVNQTLHNIEIICVDDGSTDNSLNIAKSYANNDNRFLVLHQANKKQGAARNTGLMYARGTYIQFLDADDAMVLNAYEVLYEKAANEELDVLRFASEPFYDNCNPEKSFLTIGNVNDMPSADIPCTNGEHMFCILSQQGIEYTSTCKAIYRSAYLQFISLTFIEGIIHEDNPFTFICTLKADRIAYITKQLYLRRVRTGSTMTTPLSYRNLWGYLVSYYDMSRFALMETFKPETQEYIDARLNTIAWRIGSYSNKIPNIEKHCNEYELLILQAFNLKTNSKTAPPNRIGRIITFIPRKAKKFVFCLRTHGIRYTLRKTFTWFKDKFMPSSGK